MMDLTIQIDEHTELGLRRLSQEGGGNVASVAARLLSRAVRAARPRPVFDADALQRRYEEFAAEDEALAESGSEERADLLSREDRK